MPRVLPTRVEVGERLPRVGNPAFLASQRPAFQSPTCSATYAQQSSFPGDWKAESANTRQAKDRIGQRKTQHSATQGKQRDGADASSRWKRVLRRDQTQNVPEYCSRLARSVGRPPKSNAAPESMAQPDPSTSTTHNVSAREEQLKAALWHAIGRTVDAVAAAQDINATPRFIGALSELAWAQMETAARDVEAFARHTGRSTVNASDVVLLGRRNDALEAALRAEATAARQGVAHGS